MEKCFALSGHSGVEENVVFFVFPLLYVKKIITLPLYHSNKVRKYFFLTAISNL
jgi:hypothetical protein